MRDRQARLESFRQTVEIAVGYSDELFPGAPLIRRRAVADVALFVDRALSRDTEVVRAYSRELGLELVGRVESRAAEHDRHAAADRTVAWQRIECIRAHNTNAVRVASKLFRDNSANQRLVALPGRGGVHGRGYRRREIDINAARIHPGCGGVFRVQQGLERGVATTRLQAGSDADACELALSEQP